MCGLVNRPSTRNCECGHDFEEVVALEPLLKSRRITGWAMVIGGFTLTVVAIAAIFFVSWLSVFGIAAAVGLFTKGTRVVDASNRALRDLPQLPAARVRPRDS